MKRVVKKITVIYRKLGKERADGIADDKKNVIELDPRLKGKHKMEILLHELLHILNHDFDEEKVKYQSKRMAQVCHREGLRFIDE